MAPPSGPCVRPHRVRDDDRPGGVHGRTCSGLLAGRAQDAEAQEPHRHLWVARGRHRHLLRPAPCSARPCGASLGGALERPRPALPGSLAHGILAGLRAARRADHAYGGDTARAQPGSRGGRCRRATGRRSPLRYQHLRGGAGGRARWLYSAAGPGQPRHHHAGGLREHRRRGYCPRIQSARQATRPSRLGLASGDERRQRERARAGRRAHHRGTRRLRRGVNALRGRVDPCPGARDRQLDLCLHLDAPGLPGGDRRRERALLSLVSGATDLARSLRTASGRDRSDDRRDHPPLRTGSGDVPHRLAVVGGSRVRPARAVLRQRGCPPVLLSSHRGDLPVRRGRDRAEPDGHRAASRTSLRGQHRGGHRREHRGRLRPPAAARHPGHARDGCRHQSRAGIRALRCERPRDPTVAMAGHRRVSRGGGRGALLAALGPAGHVERRSHLCALLRERFPRPGFSLSPAGPADRLLP